MNLVLFFRLILMSIFQSGITRLNTHYGGKMTYDNQFFFCPQIHAKDGFTVSLQINNGNYCSSEAGYRKLHPTFVEVEFGFPSMNEELMFKYSEMWSGEAKDFDVTGTVGRIPIEVMEKVFEKHGGIDWEKTISIEAFNRLVKEQ